MDLHPILNIAGWALLAAGLAVCAWALLWDRSRGRLRCPGCWYDMSGAGGTRCPECGRDAGSSKRLRKTRRRWRFAALGALVMLSGYAARVWVPVQSNGWVGAVPTTALVLLAPLKSDPNASQTDQTPIEALQRRDLSDWHLALLDRRWARSVERGEPGIWTRPVWPEGEHLWVEVRPGWWMKHNEVDRYVRFEWRDSTQPRKDPFYIQPSRLMISWLPGWEDGLLRGPVAVDGGLKRGVVELLTERDLPLEQRIGMTFEQRTEPVRRIPISIEVDTVSDVASLLEPAEVRWSSLINVYCRLDIRPGRLAFDPMFLGHDSVEDDLAAANNPTLGCRIEIFRDGRLVGRGSAWWWEGRRSTPRAASWIQTWPSASDVELEVVDADALYAPNYSASDWSFRMTGDPVVALRNFDCDRYWDGVIEGPIGTVRRFDESRELVEERRDPHWR